MKRIRIKKDFIVRWPITTNGEAIDLSGRDLRLVLHSPSRCRRSIDFTSEGNVAIIRITPELQTSVGSYSFTMWENCGKDGQTAVDSCRAFTLVSTTCAESDGDSSNIEIEEVVELESGDMTFTPVVVGGSNVTVDVELSATSTNPVQNKAVTKAIEDVKKTADSKLGKIEAATLYQPKGDYQPAGNYQPAGDYATSEALQNEITRATNEEKNIRALAEANKQAIENLAGSGGGSGGGSAVIVVDAALSETSENPVQNKVVTAGINEAKAAAQTAQTTANEAKTAAGTAEQSAKDYTDDQLKNYAKTEDLPTVPTKVSELDNDAEYITSADIPPIPDVSGLATKEEVSAVEKKIPTVPTDVSAFNNDAGYQTSNDVQEAIEGKANTSDIPTKVSEFENDAQYISEQTADQTYQPKGDYALKSELTDNVAYPMESHTEATLEITPNVMHVWGEMVALTITLGAEAEGRVNEYIFQFASGATATTLTLPSDLKWAKDLEDVVDGVFVPAASATYQVSIVSGLAIYTKWEYNVEA